MSVYKETAVSFILHSGVFASGIEEFKMDESHETALDSELLLKFPVFRLKNVRYL